MATDTPIGWVPSPGAIDTSGLDISKGALSALTRVDPAEWLAELARHEEFLRGTFGDTAPKELFAQIEDMRARCRAAAAGKPVPQ